MFNILSILGFIQLNSVAQSCPTLCDPHGLQHARLSCPSSTPRARSDLCPSRWWCHPAISSSVVPFFSCCQSFPTSGSFPMSQLFMSGGQTIVISRITWHIFLKLFCDGKTDMWGASWRGYRSWSLVAETMVKELCVLNKSCIHLGQISSTLK